MEVCGCNDNEKLNDIAILCCEFTAQCPSLSSEWMGAFAALCNAPVDYGYQVCTFFCRKATFEPKRYRKCFLLQNFIVVQKKAFGKKINF